MTNIQKIIPLFLVALFTAGVMAAGQSVAAGSSSTDCAGVSKASNTTDRELERIYEEDGRDN